jgi:hypothetical protein
MTVAALSVRRLGEVDRRRTVGFGALAAAAALAAGLVTARLALSGHSVAIIGLLATLLPLVLWRTPEVGPVMLVLAATMIEQLALPLPQFGGIGTDEVLYFTSLNDGLGISGVLITPLELTMAMILLVLVARGVAQRTLRLPRSHLAIGVAILFAIILFAAARGLEAGADLRTVLRELRPWVYLVAGYLIASQLLTSRRALHTILWAFAVGVGIKGLQGSYRFLLVMNGNPQPSPILSHEDAVFFSLFFLLTAALWIFDVRGWLRALATALLPAVLIADLANGRRTSWLILMAGLVALLALAWIRLPERRWLVGRVVLVLVAGGLVYFPLFWGQSNALLGEPVRAIRSAVAPGEQDRQSNLYRTYENANLMSDIRQTTPLGQGFGVPIDYSTIPGRDRADANPSLRFTPHDGILYVWMVAGIPGALAFWFVVGAAFVAACRLTRAPDRRITLLATFIVCALIAYLLEGYYDLGLWWFRVAVLIGCLLGALDAAAVMTKPAGRPAGTRRAAASMSPIFVRR